MNRLSIFAFFLIIAVTISCSFGRRSTSNESVNQSPATQASPSESKSTSQPAQAGDLQPGHAIGTYAVRGQVIELKYAYAGRAERFGNNSLVVLLTDQPIPPDALAEELKEATLLLDEKIRGLEYVLEEESMWVRYHPGQYQESSSLKLKEYKVENGIVRGFDEVDGSSSNGRYPRSVKFVATIEN